MEEEIKSEQHKRDMNGKVVPNKTDAFFDYVQGEPADSVNRSNFNQKILIDGCL